MTNPGSLTSHSCPLLLVLMSVRWSSLFGIVLQVSRAVSVGAEVEMWCCCFIFAVLAFISSGLFRPVFSGKKWSVVGFSSFYLG